VTRAILLAFGLGRVEEAEALLDRVARASLPANQLLLAVRAWILATTGRTDQAAAALDDVLMDGNQDASVFAHAAAAAVELAHDRPKRAVSHLRRSIIGAGNMRNELPWLAPYLTGVLTDALLLAGRINEATIAAADFHASHGGSGWDVAVSLSSLIQSVSEVSRPATASVDLPPPAQPGTGEPAMEVSF
jgi:predicted Zn-dependent protease